MKEAQALKAFVCDLGFSSAKWIFGKSKGKVPSVYLNTQQKLLVGSDALNATGSGGASYLRTPAMLVEYYPSFVEKCLDEAGVNKKDQVRLAVGLPAQYYEQQIQINNGAIDTLKRVLLSERVKAVEVYPQGLGGIADYHHKNEKTISGLTLSIDIGQNTVIQTLYNPATDAIISTKTHWERGVSEMIQRYFMPLVNQHISGGGHTVTEMALLMERGFIQQGLKKIDILPEVTQAADAYTGSLLKEITVDIGKSLPANSSLQTVLFFGGGATHLKQIDSDVEVVILPEPEFANSRGFMLLLEG